MISKEEARVIASTKLAEMSRSRSDITFVVIGDAQESQFGWTFFWDSTRHIETGNFLDHLAGDCPILVDKESGAIVLLPTFCDVESSLARYDELRSIGLVTTQELFKSLAVRR